MFAQTPSEELALVIKKAKKGRRPPGASATLACLHKSKLQHVDRQRIIEAVGLDFAGEYAFLPAEGTRGRIILAASSQVYIVSNARPTANTISAKITKQRKRILMDCHYGYTVTPHD
jgi:hypothetical protein